MAGLRGNRMVLYKKNDPGAATPGSEKAHSFFGISIESLVSVIKALTVPEIAFFSWQSCSYF